jgi:hypothetical protein
MEQVRQRIDPWRKTRVGRGRMPEALWRAAVALAGEHGVYATAQGLGVSYDSLETSVGKPSGAAATFLGHGLRVPESACNLREDSGVRRSGMRPYSP